MPLGACETGVRRTTSAGGRVIGKAACDMDCILAQRVTGAIPPRARPWQTGYNQDEMPASQAHPRWLSWLFLPARVLLVTFLLTLLSFAVCLLLAIVGLLITAALRGSHLNMTIAYRQIAFPAAAVACVAALTVAIAMELRHSRRNRLRLRL